MNMEDKSLGGKILSKGSIEPEFEETPLQSKPVATEPKEKKYKSRGFSFSGLDLTKPSLQYIFYFASIVLMMVIFYFFKVEIAVILPVILLTFSLIIIHRDEPYIYSGPTFFLAVLAALFYIGLSIMVYYNFYSFHEIAHVYRYTVYKATSVGSLRPLLIDAYIPMIILVGFTLIWSFINIYKFFDDNDEFCGGYHLIVLLSKYSIFVTLVVLKEYIHFSTTHAFDHLGMNLLFSHLPTLVLFPVSYFLFRKPFELF